MNPPSIDDIKDDRSKAPEVAALDAFLESFESTENEVDAMVDEVCREMSL